MNKLVATADEAITSIDAFEMEAESGGLQERLSFARAWYAHRGDDGSWKFGPSKFIGYKGLTADQYLGEAQDMDGRKTEARLAEWFVEVSKESELYNELFEALSDFLARFGKSPSRAARINVLAEQAEKHPDPEFNKLVELLVHVGKSLPPAHLHNLRARLAV